jgi:hypothetical protein
VDGGRFRELGIGIGRGDDAGCAYIMEENRSCGTAPRAGSPYCEDHHRRCHLADGSPGEQRRLKETEALAVAVGGKRGRPGRQPPDRFLRRLESVARAAFSRPKRSCIVPEETP